MGFATPTSKNSQEAVLAVAAQEGITLSSPTFSPDNNGFEDILTIQYKTSENNMVANVTIFGDLGRRIRKLIRNETVSSEGSWLWGGLNDNRAAIKPGMYIIYAELFNLEARVKKFKKAVVLAEPFN